MVLLAAKFPFKVALSSTYVPVLATLFFRFSKDASATLKMVPVINLLAWALRSQQTEDKAVLYRQERQVYRQVYRLLLVV